MAGFRLVEFNWVKRGANSMANGVARWMSTRGSGVMATRQDIPADMLVEGGDR